VEVIMRPKLLVHGSYARTISSPEEVERLLAQGWVIATPKPRSKMAKTMRTLRAQRRAAGWKQLYLWLPPEDATALKAAMLPGESYADLLARLVRQQSKPS
jgi:hypothetical protein